MANLIQEKVQEVTSQQFLVFQDKFRSDLTEFAQCLLEPREDSSSSKGSSSGKSSRCSKHQLQDCSLCSGASKQSKTKHSGHSSGKKNFPKFSNRKTSLSRDEVSSHSEEASSSDEEVESSQESLSDGGGGGILTKEIFRLKNPITRRSKPCLLGCLILFFLRRIFLLTQPLG